MRRSPLSLSSVARRSLIALGVALCALLAINSNVLAVPIAVDSYQDMESGNNGDVLTSAIMNASSHPASFTWTPSNACWVSTAHHSNLPAPILVGGVTYNGAGGTRSWKFNHNNQEVYVKGSFNSSGTYRFTVGYYFASNCGPSSVGAYDTVEMMCFGGSFLVMQCQNQDGLGPYIRPHSSYAGASNHGPWFTITSAKDYWVNLHYDSTVYQNAMAVFDPANSFAQVGSVSTCPTNVVQYYGLEFGRVENDQHGNATNDPSNCWADQVIVNYTNAAFPLLPSGANDTTPPTAPPVVRDGTNDDQSIALSTTQLSANWDMAWDAESGVKGYQYAIGTTLGGTNVVNWTSLPYQLSVTKTGLSLTTGQTYYFGVKAINGVGLTGPAANSNGQTVGTDSTGPTAPPAVRDNLVGADPGASDIDSNSDPHDIYANFDPATDPESGISGYQYCIGTTPGGTDTVNWTTLGNYYTVNATNLNPPNGVAVGMRYYVSVRGVNNAGIAGAATSSNGQVIVSGSDTTPPTAPRRSATAPARPKRPRPPPPPNFQPTGTTVSTTRAASSTTPTKSAPHPAVRKFSAKPKLTTIRPSPP